MRQLTRMFEEQQNEIRWEDGTIVIPDPSALERILPMYYKTSKFSSFQRQLNNFGYHRSYDNGSSRPVDRSKARGVCYRKVAGAPACRDIAGLLSLRPLVRRKKRPAEPVIGQRRSLINSSHFLRPPPKPAWGRILGEPERRGALFGVVHVPQGPVLGFWFEYIPLLAAHK